jgi:hypothetical protein
MVEYCSRCGEKRRDRTDWKLSRIAAETFAELTDLEHSKLWQTFRLLVFKPGQLTREYWSGRRKRFPGPVKLYFVVFALYLVLYSIHRPTAAYDVHNIPGLGLDQLANKHGLPTPQFAQEVNSRLQRYTSMSQVVYPLFVALALKLLYRRRGFYFAEHLIFALHFLAFFFLCNLVLWPFYVLFGIQTSGSVLLAAVGWAWIALYLLLALRRAYSESWLPAVIKCAVVFLTFIVTFVLFACGTLMLAIELTSGPG